MPRHHPPGTDLDNLVWLERAQDFIDMYSFDRDLLLSVIKNPDQTLVDPSSREKGYLVLRHRRGDITVLVGYKTPSNPSVVFVKLHTPDDDNATGSTQGAGTGSGSKIPTSDRQLRASLVRAGASLRQDRTSHWGVYYGDIRLGTIGSTSSDPRSVANGYTTMIRRLTAAKIAEKARKSQ